MRAVATASASRRGRTGPFLRNQRGVTLVELVILLVIAAIALPTLMIYFIQTMNHTAEAQMGTVGLGLAQELMEEVRAKRWDENVPIPNGVPTGANALGPEAGESRCDPAAPMCTSYDDIDDYNFPDAAPNSGITDPHGNPLPAYAGYLYRVKVCYVNGPQSVGDGGDNANGGACVAGATDYKKITVTVMWGECADSASPRCGRMQLDTVMANYHLDQSSS